MDQTIIDLVARKQWILLAAFIIGLTVRVVKDPRVPVPLDPRWRPLFALTLGGVASACDAVFNGTPIKLALLTFMLAPILAIIGHVLGIEMLLGGKELNIPLFIAKLSEVKKDGGGDDPPSAGGAGIAGAAAGMVLFFFSACVPILGCASLEHTGAAVANYQADLLNQTAPILREKCEQPAKVVETKEQLAKLEEHCVPAASSYDSTRIAHAVLVAALQAAVAGDSSGLVAAIQQAAAEGVKLGQALGGLK